MIEATYFMTWKDQPDPDAEGMQPLAYTGVILAYEDILRCVQDTMTCELPDVLPFPTQGHIFHVGAKSPFSEGSGASFKIFGSPGEVFSRLSVESPNTVQECLRDRTWATNGINIYNPPVQSATRPWLIPGCKSSGTIGFALAIWETLNGTNQDERIQDFEKRVRPGGTWCPNDFGNSRVGTLMLRKSAHISERKRDAAGRPLSPDDRFKGQ